MMILLNYNTLYSYAGRHRQIIETQCIAVIYISAKKVYLVVSISNK